MPKSIWSCNCKKRRKESKRLVALNDPTGNADYPDNVISNTKYTVWSFLPKNILEQFMRFMNLYFLFIAILQLFPSITPVNPVTSWFPLAFIFSLTAAKEAADDYFRYKADKTANQRQYYVIRHGVKMSIESQDISVGDLIYMESNNEAPCDLVILKTSDETGGCYIQTANLDGETDYKSRQAVIRTQNLTNEELYRVQGLIECAGPNGEIYKFDSRMILAETGQALMTGNQSRGSFSAGSEGSNNYSLKDFPHQQYISLSVNNVILQATHLRNTDWLIGVAVYTGNDTKIGQNKSHPPIKWTQMDRFVNKLVAIVFVFQLLIVIVLGVLGNVWSVYFTSEHWYLDHFSGVTYWWSWIIIPLRFVLLLSLMIPISLKVSMDLVKYAYAMFIGWDLEFFDEETSVRARAANSAISEDLGQVEYIFCDKTGTLTDNVMRFAKCTISSTTYGHNLETGNALYDTKLRQRVVERQDDVMLFFKILTLCNTVVPAHPNDDELSWKSSSPDEEAMVNAAAHFNIVFRRRHLSTLELNVCGELEHYELLNTLEFSSDRKRMSVMLRRIHNNKRSSAQMKGDADEVLLFIKGADDKILPLIHNKEDVEMATTQVDMFAKLGLRTMCVAYKRMTLREYEDWNNIFQEANTSLEERDIKLAACYAEVENNLTFVGVTAIEDKLQDAVPESIAMLQQAGIKVWMITGDKAETAIQIAKQTNLLVEGVGNLITIDGNNSMEVGDVISEALERVLYTENGEFSLLIDGKVLPYALGDNKQNFLSVVTRCKSVICCRTTPHQKAQVRKDFHYPALLIEY
jgi:phospholipid-translocating ATPase